MNLQSGLYRHYKGNNYFVLDVARHSETREPLVVYQCLYGDYSWWVRPLSMFVEAVDVAGEKIPRFAFVKKINLEDTNEFIKGKSSE